MKELEIIRQPETCGYEFQGFQSIDDSGVDFSAGSYKI